MEDSLADKIVNALLPFFLLLFMIFAIIVGTAFLVSAVTPREKLNINDYLIDKEVIENHNILIISNKYDGSNFNVIDLGEVDAESK